MCVLFGRTSRNAVEAEQYLASRFPFSCLYCTLLLTSYLNPPSRLNSA